MRLFLIRHGETVDNVAQVYAGSRDSHLTNHGFQQATRLGRYLANADVSFTRIFASPLQRAHKTAQLIRNAQAPGPAVAAWKAPEITSLPILKEQDFGFYEGKAFSERPTGSNKFGKQVHQEAHSNDPAFVDVESKESMAKRMDAFLDEHMAGLWESAAAGAQHVVAIVSHGIILSVLWRRVLRRLPQNSVGFLPELLVASRPVSLEHLGGFSNTGYLEFEMTRTTCNPQVAPGKSKEAGSTAEASSEGSASDANAIEAAEISGAQDLPHALVASPADDAENVPDEARPTSAISHVLHGWTTEIRTINGKEHLKDLKRTGRGIGSSKYDEGQKTIESFFKRRKVD